MHFELRPFEWSTSNHPSCGLIVVDAPHLHRRMFALLSIREPGNPASALGSNIVFEVGIGAHGGVGGKEGQESGTNR
jgi:hypothetical protein